ncbi:Hypothetical predicted protein, partial [Mytilus galloprovincialis]
MDMDCEKESDDKLAIQELDQIMKMVGELTQKLRFKLHNNRLKWRELANIPTKREATGRTNVQATDSGIASSTYSGTSMVMDSNAFTGVQDTNPHQSSSIISSEVDGRHETSVEN